MKTTTPNRRVRAWILISIEDPLQVTSQIWTLDEKQYGTVVIVRTDIVEGDFNLVIPIDTDPEYFDPTIAAISGIIGGANPVVLKVLSHDPAPAHNSSGYIMPSEAMRGEFRLAHPGRQDTSPGFNPWG
jgi:hypothetical protein